MTVERVYLCAVPCEYWSSDYDRFASDALHSERRIGKGVNLDSEFGRYSICCQRLEQEVMLSGLMQPLKKNDEFASIIARGRFPTIAISMEYLNLLHSAPETETGRIGASFFPPALLEEHVSAFVEWVTRRGLTESSALRQRAAFLRHIQKYGCGLVEIQSAFHLPADFERDIAPPPLPPEEDAGEYVNIPDFVRAGGTIESFGNGNKQEMALRLRERILDSLRTNDPVAFGSEAQHDVITEVLNDLVFVPPGEVPRPTYLRIMYVDGSEAEPFPLFCLPRQAPLSNGTILRAALMSMRHPELDPEIDFCWFRNRDVSRTRTLSETDTFCFDTTLTQLSDTLKTDRLHLYLYHTGFEPAVLGFYRAVVRLFLQHPTQRGRLAVTPFYFRGADGYQQGRPWC